MTADPDFSKWEGSGFDFPELLAAGAKLPPAPDPWWRRMIRYKSEDDGGGIDWSESMHDIRGVPKHDKTAASAILDEHDSEIFFVTMVGKGSRAAAGEFRRWNGRVWDADINDAMMHFWVNSFWTELGQAIEVLRTHIDTVATERRAALIASGMTEEKARQQVVNEIIKPMSADLKKIDAYYQKLGSGSQSKSLIEQMARRPSINLLEDDFDNVPGLLVCGNGVLDFTAAVEHSDPSLIALLPHDPIRRVHMHTTVDYDPTATCPEFLRYLETSLPDEDVRHYLHKALGYMLLGMPLEKVMLNITGPKDSGKTLLLNIIAAVLGGYRKAVPAGVLLHKKNVDPERPQPLLHSVRRARVVTSSEPDHTLKWDHGLIKSITGNEDLLTRTLHKENVPWRPQFTLIVASNHFVKLSVEDKAIIERIAPIKFPLHFYRESDDVDWGTIPPERRADLGLENRIVNSDDELRGILAWLVEGLRLYLVEKLEQPAAVRTARGEMEEESSTQLQHLRDRIAEGRIMVLSEADAMKDGAASVVPINSRVMLSELYHDYLVWCADNDVDRKFAEGKRGMGKKLAFRASTSGDVRRVTAGMVFDRLVWVGWEDGYRGEEPGRFGV